MVSKVANFVVSLFLFSLMSLPLHEFGHYAVANMLGVTGNVTYPYLLGGLFNADPGQVLPAGYPLIYPAGGVLTFLVFAALYWFGLRGQPWDWDDLAGLGINALIQVCYGLAEMTLYYSPETFSVIAPFAVVAAFVLGMTYYWPRLSSWWSES